MTKWLEASRQGTYPVPKPTQPTKLPLGRFTPLSETAPDQVLSVESVLSNGEKVHGPTPQRNLTAETGTRPAQPVRSMTRWLAATMATGQRPAPSLAGAQVGVREPSAVPVGSTQPAQVAKVGGIGCGQTSCSALDARAYTEPASAPTEPQRHTEAKVEGIKEADPYQHGKALNGNPKTWTGRVVSMDEWRRLSRWDRHGSTGQVWNGITRQWEPAGQG